MIDTHTQPNKYMNKNDKIIICGAGGFIGGSLIANLKGQGFHNLRAVDIKPITRWYQRDLAVESLTLDLRLREACVEALQGRTCVSILPLTWAAWVSSN